MNIVLRVMMVLVMPIVVMACTSTEDYVFRDDNRPTYDKQISVDELDNMRAENVTLLDVRLLEDYQSNQSLITGAAYRNPDNIEQWSSALMEDSKVVVYCVKGKWVSQKVAHYLAQKGIEVYSLDGGIEAWQKTNEK